jgi:demethylspheroidene O-methyltransferase
MGAPSRPAPLASALPPPTSLADRLAGWRDRLLASPRFQTWAAALPLTRPIARRRARALFDICAGFVYSQVLVACVRLDLFTILAAGPLDAPALARRLSVPMERLAVLLDAAISLRLLERRGGKRFGLGPLGASMVGNEGVAAMVRHHHLLYADLADPVGLLREPGRETRLGRFWSYAGVGSDEDVGAYTALMAASQPLVAEEVLDAIDVGRHHALLDLGGGNGTFARAAARRAPRLAITVFDLPDVAALAQARLVEAGLGDRAKAVGGDFIAGPLPQGADLATLVRVLHDHDDDAVRAILANVRRALAPGGTLIVAEPMSGTAGAAPVADAYFGLYLMAMGQGRPRSPEELSALLTEAGFETPRLLPTRQPLLVRIVAARVLNAR